MSMLCYKNGSLARKYIRDSINTKYGVKTETYAWDQCNEIALSITASVRGQSRRQETHYQLPKIIPTQARTWL